MKPLIRFAALLLLGVSLRAQNWMNPLPGGVNGAPVPPNASCLGSNSFGQLIVGTCGGGGNPVSASLSGATIIDGGSAALGNITYAGATIGQTLSVPGSSIAPPNGVWLQAAVTAPNSVTVYAFNLSGASVTLPTATYTVALGGTGGGGGSGGNVNGPGSSTVGFIPTWNNTSGTLLGVGLGLTGSANKVVTAAAAGTSGNCAQWLTGNLVDSGSPCGSSTGSPLTTKGDLYGFTTVNARVPVGTNGQVLTADSTAGPGVSWQNPGSGGGITYGAGVPTANCTPGLSGLYQDTSGVAPGTGLYYCPTTNVWAQIFSLTGTGGLGYNTTPGSPVFDVLTSAVDYLAVAQHTTAFKTDDAGRGALAFQGIATNAASVAVGPSIAVTGSGCAVALATGATNAAGGLNVTTGGTCTVAFTWGGSKAYPTRGNIMAQNATQGTTMYQSLGATTTSSTISGVMVTGDVINYIVIGW